MPAASRKRCSRCPRIIRGTVGPTASAGESLSGRTVLILAPGPQALALTTRPPCQTVATPSAAGRRRRTTDSTIPLNHRIRMAPMCVYRKAAARRAARRPRPEQGNDNVLVQVVELAVFHPGQECRDLGTRIDQGWPGRVPRVTDGDCPAGQFGDLDAAPAGIARAALAPVHARQPIGRYSVDLHLSLFLVRARSWRA